MDAVEVDGVRVRAPVFELDAEDVVLGRPDDGAGNGAVVCPGGVEDALGDLDLPVLRRQGVLANPPRLVREGCRWIGQRVEVVRSAGGRHLEADHGGVAELGVRSAQMRGLDLLAPGQRNAREGSGCDDGGDACDQLAAAESMALRHV